jgi:seryl-tRNA synthetase
MSIESVLAKLSTEDQAEVRAHYDGLIKAETAKGIDETRKTAAEKNRLLDKLKTLENAVKSSGLDLERDIAEQIAEKVDGAGSKLSDTEKQLKEMKKNLDALQKEKQAEAERAKRLSRDKLVNVVIQELGDDVPARKALAKAWLADEMVKLADDESVVFVEGGVEKDLKAAVADFKKLNPEYVYVKQAPGAAGTQHSPGAAIVPKMASADFEKLTYKEKNEFLLQKNGIVT